MTEQKKYWFVKLGQVWLGGRRPPPAPLGSFASGDRIITFTGSSNRALPFAKEEWAEPVAELLGGTVESWVTSIEKKK